MCSIGDDNILDGDELSKYMLTKPRILQSDSKCNKCRLEKPCILLRSKDCYCKNCFIAGTMHKFKAMLGKSRLISANDRVLIVHKAGHASTAMLHFIRTGLDLHTPKKLRFEPVVLFIENHSFLSLDDRKKLLEKIQTEIASFKFESYFISLPKYIKKKSNDLIVNKNPSKLDLNNEDNNFYLECAKQFKNESNKNDYIRILEREIAIEVAKLLNCQFVFQPDLSIDVASQLLTDISLGRGSHVPFDTGFCDSRDAQVKILRPLRQFEIKELVFYNIYHNLETVSFNNVSNQNQFSSIQNLMRKFVNDLQLNYPATISTVLKTGDKLATNEKINSNKCLLCKAPMDCGKLNLTSAESTNFSHWVSIQTPNYDISSQERYNDALASFINKKSNNYCFSCTKLNNK